MKRIISIAFMTLVLVAGSGCKKYLNVDPPSDLSGNNFWQTKADVEQYTNGLYELFRQAVYRDNMKAPAGSGEFPFFAFGGDMRGAPMRHYSGQNRVYVSDLASNNIRTLLSPSYGWAFWNMQRFTQWDRFFKVIAAANIAYDRIDGVPDPALTSADKARYKGEAAFLRNLCYFFMVRLWGDVPYYTQPYNAKAMPRMPMVEVLKNCAADLKAAKDGLPWTYENNAIVAVRGMRGSALVLLMHINMWLASFDDPNKESYYQEVDVLADELLNQNGGAYELLPLSRSKEIFKGRSKEGLFEIPQNVNYGESFGWSAFSDNVLYAPYKTRLITTSYLYYEPDFMLKLYPDGIADNRADVWFDKPNMRNTQGKFLMLKFTNVFANQNAEDFNPDDNQVVFRLADAYLLQAEALAHLGNRTKALQKVNVVRARAGAEDMKDTGGELLDDIFYERCRELMGEAHYWYDVVRTRRIIDNAYKFGYHCTVEQYKAGAWTWPLDPSARVNNPKVVLNSYWQ